jgi:CheY-like chemotaxis protein
MLVENMGGIINVKSSLGKGSSFYFEIPIIKAPTDKLLKTLRIKVNKSLNFKHEDLDKIKILIVDDHPANLLFLRKLLKKIGLINCTECISGEEALDAVKQERFDVMFMDCHLPKMSGMEATKKIREFEIKNNYQHCPIIAVTADVLEDTRNKCKKAGMNYYLTKPIKKDKVTEILISAIKNTLESFEDDISTKPNLLSENDEQAVDMEHLREFTEGDANEESEFFELFLKHSKISISALEESLGNKNDKEWEQAAHKLKGASANLGANRLANHCSAAEKIYDATTQEKVEVLNKIKDELSRVEKFLASLQG